MMAGRLDAALAELAAALREEIARAATPVPAAPDPLVSIADATAIIGVSRTTIAAALADGTLRSVKVGRRRLIPAAALNDFISQSADGHGPAAAAGRSGRR